MNWKKLFSWIVVLVPGVVKAASDVTTPPKK